MAGSQAGADARFHEMDCLRAFSMLLGVVYHALFTFTGWVSGYFCVDVTSGPWAALAALIPHGFRVELFYLIGGFFGHLVLTRYGLPGFMKNRASRILRPFVIAALLIIPTVRVLGWYSERIGHAPPTMAIPTQPAPFYLWFLFYMVMMDGVTVLTLLIARVIPLGKLLPALDRAFERAAGKLWAPFVLAIPSSLLLLTHPGSTFLSYVPQPGWLAYYLGFFVFGWWLHRAPELRFRLVPWRWVNLGLGGAAFAAQQIGSAHLPEAAKVYLGAFYAWSAALGLTGLFVASFQKPNRRLRYLADSSYWVYLAHWPLLTLLQITVAPWPVPGPVKVIGLVSVVVGITLVAYRYLVRFTFIGRALNGPRERDPLPVPAATPPPVTKPAW